jgi:hypothetical protein
MHDQSKQDQSPDVVAERLVVLPVAGVPRGRKRSLVHAALGDLGGGRVDAAISSLQSAGVVRVVGEEIRQAPAIDRLDRLDLICL